MQRLKKRLCELESRGKQVGAAEAEPSTPSTILSPVATQMGPSECMFQGLRRDKTEWHYQSIEPSEPLESLLDRATPIPSKTLWGRLIRSLESHRACKHKQAPVNTLLGLVHVRFAEIPVQKLPLSDMRIAAILSCTSFHLPDSIEYSPLVRSLLPDSVEGFPCGIVPADSRDAQAMVWFFESNKSLFVAFRGNHNLDRFYKNMGLLQVEEQRGGESRNAVSGLVADFRRIEIFLRPLLEPIVPHANQIFFVGAGIGGGIATIAAPFIGQLFDRQVNCITFGSPKVGNEYFVEWYESRVASTLRVVSSSDPVPYLPLNRPDLMHVCDSLCISKNGYVERWGKNLKPSPKVTVTIENMDFDDFRWEHYAHKYRKMILALISRSNKGLPTTKMHQKLDRGRI